MLEEYLDYTSLPEYYVTDLSDLKSCQIVQQPDLSNGNLQEMVSKSGQ